MAQPIAAHPTVLRLSRRLPLEPAPASGGALDAGWRRQLALDAGADDVGFVATDRPKLNEQRGEILQVFPQMPALIRFVCRMNRTPIRSTARSIANLAFHRVGNDIDAIGHRIVAVLERHGIASLNPRSAFRWSPRASPARPWSRAT